MSTEESQNFQPGDPRLIMQWARRYAKSRTISFLVQWVFIVVIVVAIAITGSLTNQAYVDGNTGQFTISMVFMVLAMLALTWFSASSWSGELIWRITQWLYGEEGYADYGSDREGPLPLWITALGGGLVIYHIAGAILVSFGYLSLIMLQPFSAAYMCPFLGLMIVYQRLGLWAWIWPVCYGVHGILLVGGAPIAITGQWQLLNLVLPVFGYGLIAILIGHAYSRFALYKLKQVARTGLDEAGAEENDEDDAT